MLMDSEALCKLAENLESTGCKKISFDRNVLVSLEGSLLDVYNTLRPKPDDYEQRSALIDAFSKMADEIFGHDNGIPVVEAFGSFTMDLFTAGSDLDLSINFSADSEAKFARDKKISVLRKITKVLYSHQNKGHVCGVCLVTRARVPVLKVVDRGTGIECDISVENQDGITRSMVFKLISSIDERFQILSYLMKMWAKANKINSPKDRTMSSMSIISLVAFHLQTRHPPILPAFSVLLKDGTDFASIEKNVLLFKEFGSNNKESVAELFVSLISKLSSVESLWEHGLCTSNYEGSWISKTVDKEVGNLTVEDFLDQSQNFARAVGEVEMQKICECLRVCLSNLLAFMSGQIEAPKLKTLLFGSLHLDTKRKRKLMKNPDSVTNPLFGSLHLDTKRRRNLMENADSMTNHVPKKRTKTHYSNHKIVAGASIPTVHVPSVFFQPRNGVNWRPTHISQPLAAPSGFNYGLQPPQFPVVPRISQVLLCQPPANLIHLNHATQLHLQGRSLLVPMLDQRPVGNRFHPYYGTQQFQHDQNMMLHEMPFGIPPNIWR